MSRSTLGPSRPHAPQTHPGAERRIHRPRRIPFGCRRVLTPGRWYK